MSSIPGSCFKVFSSPHVCWILTGYTKTHYKPYNCSQGIRKLWKSEKAVESASPSCLVWWQCVFSSHGHSVIWTQNLQEVICDVGTISLDKSFAVLCNLSVCRIWYWQFSQGMWSIQPYCAQFCNELGTLCSFNDWHSHD